MFEKMYNESISKVKPDSELIESTKKIMLNELENKEVIKNINFYKYASIAACIVVVISVLAIYPKNIIRDLGSDNAYISNGSLKAEDKLDNYFDAKDNFSKPNYSNDSFNSLEGINGDIGGMVGVNSAQKSNSFLDWIKGIIQWFYELLF